MDVGAHSHPPQQQQQQQQQSGRIEENEVQGPFVETRFGLDKCAFPGGPVGLDGTNLFAYRAPRMGFVSLISR